jgi:hypothetical protein
VQEGEELGTGNVNNPTGKSKKKKKTKEKRME